MSASVLDRVLAICADVLGAPRDQLSIHTTADQVEAWDSIHTLNLAMAVEAEFGVFLSPDDMAELQSVGLIVEILAGKGVA